MMAEFKRIDEMKQGEKGFIHSCDAGSLDEDGCLLIEFSRLVFPTQAPEFPETMIVRRGLGKDDYTVIFPELLGRSSCPLKKNYDPNKYAKINRISTRK